MLHSSTAHALRWLVCLGLCAVAPVGARAQAPSFVNFETLPTRALALSEDGTRLFAVNPPDGRLEILSVTAAGLEPAGSVAVGLEPIAVAVRSPDEVWVVNHLSDSVSIVDVSASPARVTRTLLVGDEPRDVVFAGPDRRRAFISAARRGQNHPDDTVNETQVPGLGRADVWVFDAQNLGSALGGTPLEIVQLFGDKPGALGVTPDGRSVIASIFTSGNQTTTINQDAVCGADGEAGEGLDSRENAGPCPLEVGGMAPGGIPAPNRNAVDGLPNPRTGLIVQFDEASGGWLDGLGRDWGDAVPFELPDQDVFRIDAMADPPRVSGSFAHVGTLNKSVAVNPASGAIFVATIDAINTNRFLSVPRLDAFPNPTARGGAARTADPATGLTLNGHLYESRIAILQPGAPARSRHLNKHIDYEVVPSPAGVKERSIADPQGLAFSEDGNTLFVAGLGSNAIVPFRTAELEDDSFVPDGSTHIQLSGDGGPTDMVIAAGGERMFVYKRFDNAVATVDLTARREIAVTPLFNPEPPEVRAGRKFFYDADLGSSNGEANCNVCHPGADKDDLAWNLGAPFERVLQNPNRPVTRIQGIELGGTIADLLTDVGGVAASFNPLKGPMTVLTLRGIANGGSMFWRGDASNDTDPLDARTNFGNFNVVFEALLGREASLPQSEFDALTDWVLTLTPPPNPHRPLDNQLRGDVLEGEAVFTGQRGAVDGPFVCSDCHVMDPAQGFFGTRGDEFSFEGETQIFKITGLRTTYDKIGMFGQTRGKPGDPRVLGGPRTRTGPQIRGTGTVHDGSLSSPEEFLTFEVFQLEADEIKQVVDFIYAFPTNLAPVVGQQVTLRAESGPDVVERVELLQSRAAAGFALPGVPMTRECDLVARAALEGRQRGFLFDPQAGDFRTDDGGRIDSAALRALARTPGQEVTFTCVYPGGGERIALDRDLDGALDGES